jgi:hypothetical protein
MMSGDLLELLFDLTFFDLRLAALLAPVFFRRIR